MAGRVRKDCRRSLARVLIIACLALLQARAVKALDPPRYQLATSNSLKAGKGAARSGGGARDRRSIAVPRSVIHSRTHRSQRLCRAARDPHCCVLVRRVLGSFVRNRLPRTGSERPAAGVPGAESGKQGLAGAAARRVPGLDARRGAGILPLHISTQGLPGQPHGQTVAVVRRISGTHRKVMKLQPP